MEPEDAKKQSEANASQDATEAYGVIDIVHYEVSSEAVTSASPDAAVGVIDSVADALGVIDVVQYDVPDENINISPASSTIPDTIEPEQYDELILNAETVIDTSGSTRTPLSNTNNEAIPMATNQNPSSSSSTSDEKFEDWVVIPESSWPPPIFVKRDISARERFYLEYRWHSQWAYYDSKATQNKNTYYWYQRIVVIGSLIIPALISLNSAIARFITDVAGGDANLETMVRIGVDSVTVFISLLVAGSAALESLYKYGENWSSYRSAAEELQAEKNFYDMQAGPYLNNPSPFATFVERVEGVVANQNGKYFQAVQSQIAKQSAANENIVESFLTGDDDDNNDDDAREYAQSESVPEV